MAQVCSREWSLLLLKNDDSAREQLWWLLLRWALKLAHERCAEEASVESDFLLNIVLEAFSRIELNKADFTEYAEGDNSTICAWCRLILTNEFRRAMKRRINAPLTTPVDDFTGFTTGCNDYKIVELLEAIERCLSRLSERENTTVRRHCIEGVPIPELASELDITANYAHQILHRARKKLRACLDR